MLTGGSCDVVRHNTWWAVLQLARELQQELISEPERAADKGPVGYTPVPRYGVKVEIAVQVVWHPSHLTSNKQN